MCIQPIFNVFCILGSAGGIIGFLRKRSVPSLIAGVGLGSLYAISGALVEGRLSIPGSFSLDDINSGYALGLFASAVLTLSMGKRTAKSIKPVPTSLFLVGALASSFYAKKLYDIFK